MGGVRSLRLSHKEIIFEPFPHLPSMVSVYADEEESVSRGGEDFGEEAGEEEMLTVVEIISFLHKLVFMFCKE